MPNQACYPKLICDEWRTDKSRAHYSRKGADAWKLQTRFRRYSEAIESAKFLAMPGEEVIVVRVPEGARPQPEDELKRRFNALAAEWKEATQYQSSPTSIAMHPAYQRIIGMGPKALPWILREVTESGGFWFWALQAITGVDPVKPEDRGRISAMRRAWKDWADAQGYIR